MNLKTRTKIITLDWDSKSRMRYYLRKIAWYRPVQNNIREIRVRRSATKGYHCMIKLYTPVPAVRTRYELGDDPYRLIGDLLRIEKINNILWDYKHYNKKIHKAGKWIVKKL